MSEFEDGVEDYLDELLRRSHGDARATRRLLDEAADHLHCLADELVAAGADRAAAEREAVRRFGAADRLARVDARRSLWQLAFETARAAALLLGAGLAAIGVSGLVAAAMNLGFGREFVGGPHLILAAGGASSTEIADDAVVLRALAGLLGVALLGAVALSGRRAGRRQLPAALTPGLAAVASALAALALTGASIGQLAAHGPRGVGFFLSGAIAALAAAAVFAAETRRVAARLRGFDRRRA